MSVWEEAEAKKGGACWESVRTVEGCVWVEEGGCWVKSVRRWVAIECGRGRVGRLDSGRMGAEGVCLQF